MIILNNEEIPLIYRGDKFQADISRRDLRRGLIDIIK